MYYEGVIIVFPVAVCWYSAIKLLYNNKYLMFLFISAVHHLGGILGWDALLDNYYISSAFTSLC